MHTVTFEFFSHFIPSNFNLLLFKYKRIEPNYKNLYYKKILTKLSKVDSTKFDIALVAKDKILETGTSNLVFVKNGKIFSPKKNCYFGNTLKFISKKIKINFKDISIKSVHDYEEIILIGSGKGVTSVSKINDLKWMRRKTRCYTKLNKIYVRHFLKPQFKHLGKGGAYFKPRYIKVFVYSC